ncbi:peroxiredoxin [Streptomyces sp. DSM 42041]|uniref:thioredoxin-dependent peroxiredoxin n=1 Tax=Streptomyces hazeniae TaxID=3075538 RepID=A0ABU2NT62_9ACTN|nr:peroxiredoxin [Streptomyces sp. DSM 42041]MDT0379915.1 peroxiredoxin [Streptomyces sp. DSM 42041]
MAKPTEAGGPAPQFSLPGGVLSGEGPEAAFVRADYTVDGAPGRPLVLAFYPGDDTAVCTKQLCSYSSGLERFEELDATVWGISPQGVDSHERFARKHDLRMPLLADTDGTVARAYGVAAPGIGLRRSVFLVAPDGTVAWKHVALLGMTYQDVDTLTARLAALRKG